jgi:SOS-response transcriptional repressor LexA
MVKDFVAPCEYPSQCMGPGEKLRLWREAQKPRLSQRKAAELFETVTGVTRDTWASYELERAAPPAQLLHAISRRDEIPLVWWWDESMEQLPLRQPSVGDPLYPVAMLYAPMPKGSPVPAGTWASPQDTDEMIEVPGFLVEKGRFACEAEGSSMLPLIEQGDLLIFQGDPRPRPGVIVLARNGHGEVTVKVLRVRDSGYILESLNAAYPHASADYIEHIGYLVAIWKREGSGKGHLNYDDGGIRP